LGKPIGEADLVDWRIWGALPLIADAPDLLRFEPKYCSQ
jgi:hypothetical protein